MRGFYIRAALIGARILLSVASSWLQAAPAASSVPPQLCAPVVAQDQSPRDLPLVAELERVAIGGRAPLRLRAASRRSCR